MGHVEQKESDDIAVIIDNYGVVVACGYKCSRCGREVFPLGACFSNDLLTQKELNRLNQKCVEV